MHEDVDKTLRELLESYPPSVIKSSLNRIFRQSHNNELTVVVNFGMHALPEEILRGDVFFFSEGNVDISSDGVKETVELLSKRAVKYLRRKTWNKVNLIPSGHPLLVAMATLIVYRVTRISPTVVFYVDGDYRDVELNVRADAVRSNTLK